MGFFFKDNCQNIDELCHKLRACISFYVEK